MKISVHPFWKSKRTWGLIALGVADIARSLWPEKVPDLSMVLRAMFGGA